MPDWYARALVAGVAVAMLGKYGIAYAVPVGALIADDVLSALAYE